MKLRMKRTLQALNTKPFPRTGEQLFKHYADLFFNRTMQKGGFCFLSYVSFFLWSKALIVVNNG